jgi:hypothetical protein
MRLLVCGGRDYDNYYYLSGVLDGMGIAGVSPDIVICGGARGADQLASIWAGRNNVPRYTFLAEWDKYGAAAGPMRNQKMIDKGKPDMVLAFPGGKGTADMVRRAKAAGIPVTVIEDSK